MPEIVPARRLSCRRRVSASAWSSQKRMSISRYIAVARRQMLAGLLRADRPSGRACPGRNGSGRRADACRARRPGPRPRGSSLPPSRPKRSPMGGDVTEQAEAPRLVTALLVALRQGHGLLRTLQSVVEPPLEQVCLAEPCELHRPSHAHRAHRRCVSRHLLEKAPSLERALGERVGMSETSEDRPGLEVPRMNEGARAFQRLDGPIEITLRRGRRCPRQSRPRQG